MIRHVHLTKEESVAGRTGYHHLAERILDRVNFIEKSNALVLIHMGESFSNEKMFAHELRVTMDWLNTIAQRPGVQNKVVWLTSWPQHYPNSVDGNGYYPGAAGVAGSYGSVGHNNAAYSCVPRTNVTNDWRNNMLIKMLATPEYQAHMDLFDDRYLMGPLYDMHKGGGDCTHLCYSPIIHQLLWDAISRYVEHYESLDP